MRMTSPWKAGLWLWLLLLIVPVAQAVEFNMLSVGRLPPGQQWQTLETEHFRIHHASGAQHWAEHVAAMADDIHQVLSDQLRWQPAAKTELVLTDDYDLSNGWATSLPFNQSRLYLSPPDSLNSLENYRDWLELLLVHEYTHVLHLDKASGVRLSLRRLFGRTWYSAPNTQQPVWLLEGVAVLNESIYTPAVGRLNGAWFNMQMCAEQGRGLLTLNQVTVPDNRWPSGSDYLYGAWFTLFLVERYGRQALQAYIDIYSDQGIPFLMNSALRRAIGKDFQQLWGEFADWLPDQLACDEDTESQSLTSTGLAEASPVAVGDWVYRISHDGHGPYYLSRYRAGYPAERLFRMRQPGLFDVGPQGQVVYVELHPDAGNRYQADLWQWREGRKQRLTRGQRYREARYLPDGSMVARRLVNGVAELDLLDAQGRHLRTLWRGAPGEVVGQLAIAPDGRELTAAFKPVGASWQLQRMALTGPDSGRWQALTVARGVQGTPAYSADGNGVLFTADFDGRYNLYRVALDGSRVQRLTRVTGALSPVQTTDGQIYFQRYGAEGFDLHVLAASSQASAVPELAPGPQTPALASTAAEADITPYRPWSTLRPHWWFPLIASDGPVLELGLTTGGLDALGRHQYALTLGAEATEGEPLGSLVYQYSNRLLLTLQRELNYRTEDDELLRIRARHQGSLAWLNVLSGLDSQFALHAGLFAEHTTDAFLADGQVRTPDWQRSVYGLAARYSNAQRYRYSISPTTGRSLMLTAESNTGASDFDGQIYQLNLSEYLHLGRSHVLAGHIHLVHVDDGGLAFGLGGGAGILSQGWFGRDEMTLRGYDRGTVFAGSLGKASLEYRFPLLDVQRNWNLWPVGLGRIHGALTSEVARAERVVLPDPEDRTLIAVGAELTTELVLGYNALLPVRAGYARGLDDELGRDQWYLRLEASF